MESEVLVSDLVKRYPKSETNAVDGLGFEVLFGEIFGLLGPNGAGKSTTIGVLTTRVKPTSGRAEIAGVDVTEDPVRVKRLLAVVPQQVNLDRSLTPRQNLVFHATYHGYSGQDAKRRAAELLAEFGLEEQADTKVDWYSGGMAQRLMVARSMMHEPRVLFLDEPTTGLDPRSRGQVWDIIRMLVAGGTTVLLTTQYLEEADQLADRIAVIDHGRVIAEGTSAELKASVGTSVLHVQVADPSQRESARVLLLGWFGDGVYQDSDPRALSVQLADGSRAAPALAALAEAGIEVSQFSLGQPSLDEVFFALTGHPAEHAAAEEEETEPGAAA